jgi:carbonic anhydrase
MHRGASLLTRRTFVGALAASLPLLASTAYGQSQDCAVFTADRQAAMTPDDAVARLRDGNARFVGGRSINCDLMQQVRETAGHQSPYAAVVGCIDSRVPPELVFDQRIGDIFCARVAGNFVNTDILGSLEYATAVAGAKVIVILGHSSCGAIKSAVDGVEAGNITALLENFAPALATLTPDDGERSSANTSLVAKVAEQNVLLTAAGLRSRSPMLDALVADGELVILSAMHDLNTGQVSWLA